MDEIPDLDIILPEENDQNKDFAQKLNLHELQKTPIDCKLPQSLIDKVKDSKGKTSALEKSANVQKKEELLNIIPQPDLNSLKRELIFAQQKDKTINQNIIEQENQPKKINKIEIYKDYNCMLNLTDVAYGVKGHNKFYQICLQKKSDDFILFTKWGRVGAENPQQSLVTYTNQYDAISAFKKKFFDKTFNSWDNRDAFQTKPGKYTLIQLDSEGNQGKASEIQIQNQKNLAITNKIQSIPSMLPEKVFSLLAEIWDIKQMTRTLQDLNFDVEKSPLGKLSSIQIQKGYKILTEIQNTLQKSGKQTLLIELTNQFYTNIPQNYGMKKLPLIDTMKSLREKVQLLDVLKELDIASKLMQFSFDNSAVKNKNPIDLFYENIKIDINHLNTNSQSYQIIQEMIQNTHAPTHTKYQLQIIDIFEINRYIEDRRFFAFNSLQNKQLLFHGTRMTNFVGILSNGLKIAPPDAPITGYMFGKGIYFTDIVSKSTNYCHANKENPYGLLLICEVALGNSFNIYSAKSFSRPPKFYHSICGTGQMKTDPLGKKFLENNIIANTGKIIQNEELIDNAESKLQYTEYIVYDVGQIRIKYIVKLKFQFVDN